MTETPTPSFHLSRCVNCGMAKAACVRRASKPRRKRLRCCGSCRHHDIDGPTKLEVELAERRRRDEARVEADRRAHPSPLKVAAAIAAHAAPTRNVYSTSTPTTKEP